MSYATQNYETRELTKIVRFIREFPFAVLLLNGVPTTYTMTPLFFYPNTQTGDMPEIFGHLDKKNPAINAIASHSVTAIFLGPNGYISPHDYVTRQFPTWNYACAEIFGEISFVESKSETLQLMKHQIEELEGGNELPIDFRSSQVQQMLQAICFFRIKPVSMVGRFKFSQEKPIEDRYKAVQRLCTKSAKKMDTQLPLLADLETGTTDLATEPLKSSS